MTRNSIALMRDGSVMADSDLVRPLILTDRRIYIPLFTPLQLQNRSFHVAERTRTSTKCQKLKYARAKRAEILFFIVKYANLWSFGCRRRLACLNRGDFPGCVGAKKSAGRMLAGCLSSSGKRVIFLFFPPQFFFLNVAKYSPFQYEECFL